MIDIASMEAEIALAVADRYIALAGRRLAADRWSRDDAVVALEFVCRRLTPRQVGLALGRIEDAARA